MTPTPAVRGSMIHPRQVRRPPHLPALLQRAQKHRGPARRFSYLGHVSLFLFAPPLHSRGGGPFAKERMVEGPAPPRTANSFESRRCLTYLEHCRKAVSFASDQTCSVIHRVQGKPFAQRWPHLKRTRLLDKGVETQQLEGVWLLVTECPLIL